MSENKSLILGLILIGVGIGLIIFSLYMFYSRGKL